MPKLSAGLLLYRVRNETVEVLIGHPGGPFWARKDDGAWSIPKGEYTDDEDAWVAAQREFAEEIGQALTGVHRVGVLENIFLWGGATVHEIVIVLSASFADVAAYEIEEQTVRDSPSEPRVIWRAPGAVSPPLYPGGIAALASLEA